MTKVLAFFRAFWKPIVAIISAIVLCWLLLVIAGYDAQAAFKALYGASFKNTRALGTWLNKSCPLLFTGHRRSAFLPLQRIQYRYRRSVSARCDCGYRRRNDADRFARHCHHTADVFSGRHCGSAVGSDPRVAQSPLRCERSHHDHSCSTILRHSCLVTSFADRCRIPRRQNRSPSPLQKAHIFLTCFRKPGCISALYSALIVAVIAFIWLFKTYYGYEMRAVGLSPIAAQCGGINVQRTMITAMILSGGIAGLGGAIELAGTSHFLFEGISPGYGYTAIAVSILASNNPIGVVLSALLFGFLNAGSTAMQRAADVSASFVNIFQGVIVVFVALAEMSRQRGKRLTVKGGK